MVRFRFQRPKTSKESIVYFPYYRETWTTYDPDDTSKCKDDNNWEKLWEKDKDRDYLHQKNSFYYSRDTRGDEELEESSTLAIILFGSIIFCLFVPQIIDLLISVFCAGPLPPPSPATPPPGPKCRKRLRLYHYACENRTRNSDRRQNSSFGKELFYYDPENILNYISATRIRAFEDFSGDEADDEYSESEAEKDPLTKKPVTNSNMEFLN